MKHIAPAIIVLLFTSALSAAEPDVVFRDTFAGKIADGWTWLRENPETHQIGKAGLSIRVEPGVAHNVKNALLRPAPDRKSGKFAIDVVVTFTSAPTNQYEQAGITWYQKGKPVFKLVHEHIDGREYIIPGKKPAPERTVRLRLIVDKSRYIAQYQPNARGEFKTAATGALPPGNDEQVSIQCYNGPVDAEHWIRFSDFLITKIN